jgi:hypothetical protein
MPPRPKSALRLIRLLPMLPLCALCACWPRPQVALTIPPAHCLDQVPDSLKADTPGAAPPPAPASNAELLAVAKDWMGFAVAQSAQLATANRDKRSTVEIIQRCEAREAEIRTALQPKRKRFGLF